MRQPHEITYRDAVDADRPAIERVHDRARPHELAGSCDPRAFVPLADDPEAAELSAYALRVACVDGRVIAFSGVRADGCIGWLYIDPDWARRGIGRHLLREMLATHGDAAWTICLAGNDAALRLYESEGMRPVKRFEGENAGYPCTCVRLTMSGSPAI